MICLAVVEDKESVMKSVSVLDGQRRVLAIELGYVCRCQFHIAEGIDFHGYARLFFRQQVKCADIHIAVNENDVLRSFLYQTCQQAEGIVDLTIEKYFLAEFRAVQSRPPCPPARH